MVVLALFALLLGACSDDDGDDDATPGSTSAVDDGAGADDDDGEGTGSDTTAGDDQTVAGPLHILVTNDDGYDAAGINTLVEALLTLEHVEVTVYAPSGERSGSGGRSTEGELTITEVETLGGYPAVAVDGFPADAVRVAIEDHGLEPHAVISGINAGQNIGPVVDISGTIGAARAGAARGVPSLALSAGTSASGEEGYDYDYAVPAALDWVEENREALLNGSAEVFVTSVNTPSCDTGEIRGMVETEPDLDGDIMAALGFQDCTSAVTFDDPDGDVEPFLNGYGTITVVPDEPAVPAEVSTTVPVEEGTTSTEAAA